MGFDILVEPHGDLSYEMKQLRELEEEMKKPEGHWLAEYFKPESVLEENEEQERQNQEKYEFFEREHLYNLQKQQGETIDPDLVPSPNDTETLEDDDDEDEDDINDEAEEEEGREEPLSQGTAR